MTIQPAGCSQRRRTVVADEPDQTHISIGYVERENLTMRRVTRLANPFSKNVENHARPRRCSSRITPSWSAQHNDAPALASLDNTVRSIAKNEPCDRCSGQHRTLGKDNRLPTHARVRAFLESIAKR